MEIIGDVRKECASLERKPIVNSLLDIVEDTFKNQTKIINSYDALVKKLEAQIILCQKALEESTRREIEQLELIMELKQTEMGKDAEDDKDC